MTNIKMPPVYTFYRSNISPEIISCQARVFEHLGIELIQCLDDGLSHSDWLDKLFREDRELTLVCDIDAFPLSQKAFINFVERVSSGAVVGLEQVANHLNPHQSYAGPMFLGCLGETFDHLGRPTLSVSKEMDVGQNLTVIAQNKGISVEMIAPQFAIQPKWALAGRGVFGIGTFYGSLEFFHLFESRLDSSIALFKAVSAGVISGKHDFTHYISSIAQPAPRRRRFWSFGR